MHEDSWIDKGTRPNAAHAARASSLVVEGSDKRFRTLWLIANKSATTDITVSTHKKVGTFVSLDTDLGRCGKDMAPYVYLERDSQETPRVFVAAVRNVKPFIILFEGILFQQEVPLLSEFT